MSAKPVEQFIHDAHERADARRRSTIRTLITAGTLISLSLATVTDLALSEDVKHCTVTPGGTTTWNNGEATADRLRTQGSSLDSRDVIDELNKLPDGQGNRAGIEVCATDRTGVIGSFMPVYIEVTP